MKHIFFVLSSIAAVLIGCSKFPNPGGGYRLVYTPMDEIGLIDSNNTVIIGGNIERLNFDSMYIIAEEKPRNFILKRADFKPNMTLDDEEKILRKSPIRQYWIINKINDSIYGPLTKDEYSQKKMELGISEKLILENP